MQDSCFGFIDFDPRSAAIQLIAGFTFVSIKSVRVKEKK